MVVTMGAQGAVYATNDGEEGWCPAKKVDVKDTTGAGDAFFAGVTIGRGMTSGGLCSRSLCF
jgi:pseudouridine kinase